MLTHHRTREAVKDLAQLGVEVPNALERAVSATEAIITATNTATARATAAEAAATSVADQLWDEALAGGPIDVAGWVSAAEEAEALGDQARRFRTLAYLATDRAVVAPGEEPAQGTRSAQVLAELADDLTAALRPVLADVVADVVAATKTLGGRYPLAGDDALEASAAVKSAALYLRDGIGPRYARLRSVQETLAAAATTVDDARATVSIAQIRGIDDIWPGWAGPTTPFDAAGNLTNVPAPWPVQPVERLVWLAARRQIERLWLPLPSERQRIHATQLAARDARHEQLRAELSATTGTGFGGFPVEKPNHGLRGSVIAAR